MSWICPNCSSSNDEEQLYCFVCGMERPSGGVDSSPEADECRIVFSDFEMLKESLRALFKSKPEKPAYTDPGIAGSAKPVKAPKTEIKTDDKPKTEKPMAPKSDFADPWPEHKIKFDFEAIRAKGYVRSEQTVLGGVNGYTFYKEGGPGQFIRVEMLLLQKMAHKV